jgi:hypothetical protein
MHHRRIIIPLALSLTIVIAGYLALADSPQPKSLPLTAAAASVSTDPARAADDMAGAATAFWNSLTPEQQKTAHYEVKDEERFDWHFIPKPRKGLTIKAMDSAQRALAYALLSSGLSHHGFAQALTIMSLDQVLKTIEPPGGKNVRDPEMYYFTIFGQPGPKGAWGWRVEGHHLSLNFLIVDGKAIASAPAFFGANPAEVRDTPRKGLRTLGAVEDLGRQLVKSLSPDQQKTAIITGAAPKDIVTSNARKAMIEKPQGVLASDMTPEQQQILTALIREYAQRHRPELAADDLQRVEQAGFGKIRFAWAGDTEPGKGHYYRIHGPTFLVEYDNTQNNANHVHSVWRDLQNDFGEDLLAKHYQESPHNQ